MVRIATRLGAGESCFRTPAENFSLLKNVQTDSGAYLLSCSTPTGAISPGASGQTVMFTTKLHRATSLRTYGAVHPLLLHAFKS
jgi:hypothetical protein